MGLVAVVRAAVLFACSRAYSLVRVPHWSVVGPPRGRWKALCAAVLRGHSPVWLDLGLTSWACGHFQPAREWKR